MSVVCVKERKISCRSRVVDGEANSEVRWFSLWSGFPRGGVGVEWIR